MSKTVVIHQPDFMPYLGFFHRFQNADLWVILDNVQFVTRTSKSWMNRDKIKTPSGEKWITVAVQKVKREMIISEILLSNTTDWRTDNRNLIRQNYRGSQFFSEIMPYIDDLYACSCDRMIDFNLKSIDMLLSLFNIHIEKVMASSLHPSGKSNDLLVDVLTKVGATTYLSGTGARNYFDPMPFAKSGIEVVWQDFKHPVYPQQFGDFIPYLSSMDLFFNCGIEQSRAILRSI